MSSVSSSAAEMNINQWLREIFRAGQTPAVVGVPFNRRFEEKYDVTLTIELKGNKLKFSLQYKIPLYTRSRDLSSAHFMHLEAILASDQYSNEVQGKCSLFHPGFIKQEFEYSLPISPIELKAMVSKSWKVFASSLKKMELELTKPFLSIESLSPTIPNNDRSSTQLLPLTSSMTSPLPYGLDRSSSSSSSDSRNTSSLSTVFTSTTLNLRCRLQTNKLKVIQQGNSSYNFNNNTCSIFQGEYDEMKVTIHRVVLEPTEQEKAFKTLDNLVDTSCSTENVKLVEIKGYIVGDISGSNYTVTSSIANTNTFTISSKPITILIVSEIPILSYSWYQWWMKIQNFDIVFHEYDIVQTCTKLLDALIILQSAPHHLQFSTISPHDIFLTEDQKKVIIDILPIFLSSLSLNTASSPLIRQLSSAISENGESRSSATPSPEEMTLLAHLFTPPENMPVYTSAYGIGILLLMLFFSNSVASLASAPLFMANSSGGKSIDRSEMFYFYQDPPLPLSPIVFEDIQTLIDLTTICPEITLENIRQYLQELLHKMDVAVPTQYQIQDFDHDPKGEHPIKKIGFGGESNVFRAFLLPKQEWVALKVANINDVDRTIPLVMKSLLYEVQVHSELRHVNIVRLYGVLGANVQLCSLCNSHIVTPTPQTSTVLSTVRSSSNSGVPYNNSSNVFAETASTANAITNTNNYNISNNSNVNDDRFKSMSNQELEAKQELDAPEQYTMVDDTTNQSKLSGASTISSNISMIASDMSIKSVDAFAQHSNSHKAQPLASYHSHLQAHSTISTYSIEGASHRLVLVTELCPYGDLYKLLEHYHKPSNRERFNGKFLPILLSILYDVACGMDYLHAQKILHRDLKPKNVFLTKDLTVNNKCFVAKIGDLGIAKRLSKVSLVTDSNQSEDMANNSSFIQTIDNGSLLYIAPETITQGKCTRRSDVFSFAMLMHDCLVTLNWRFKYRYFFEIGAGYTPHNFVKLFKTHILRLNPQFDMDENSPWSTLPVSIQPELEKLMNQCFDRDAKKRLLFGEIKTKLAQLRAEYSRLSGV